VMELCVDNPREGFADLFATHPSVESRIAALVKYAGGHDPGPLALPTGNANEMQERPAKAENSPNPPPLPSGPWDRSRDSDEVRPDAARDAQPTPWRDDAVGPWGRH